MSKRRVAPWLREDSRSRHLIPLALVVALVVTQIQVIKQLGLHYDEVLFVNAATEGLTDTDNSLFVRRRVFGVPILLMDYIGALKAWLYVPIFAVFGVSIWSIRLPMLALGSLTLLLAPGVVGRGSRSWSGILLILLLVVDPVFWTSLTADTGPIAIAAFLRVLTLSVILRVLFATRAPHQGTFLLIACLLSLGTFNKLDFIFFSVPLLVVSVLLFLPRWKDLWSCRRLDLVFASVVLTTSHILFVTYMFLPSRESSPRSESGGLTRLQRRLELLDATFDGRFTMDMIAGFGERPRLSLTFEILTVGFLISLFVSIRMYLKRRGRDCLEYPTRLEFITWLTVGIVLLQLAVGGVQAPWHVMHLWPLPQALVVGLVFWNTEHPYRRNHALNSVGVAVYLAAILVSLSVMNDFRSFLQDPERRSVSWTDDTQELAEALTKHAKAINRPVAAVTADWGIGTQLQALTAQSEAVTVKDFWPQFPPGDISNIREALNYHTPDEATQVVLVRHLQDSILVVQNSVEVSQQLLEDCGSLEVFAPIFVGRHIEALATEC